MACTGTPSYSGGWAGRITWVWAGEAAVNYDGATVLQCGQQNKTLSLKKKKHKKERKFGRSRDQESKNQWVIRIMEHQQSLFILSLNSQGSISGFFILAYSDSLVHIHLVPLRPPATGDGSTPEGQEKYIGLANSTNIHYRRSCFSHVFPLTTFWPFDL